METGDSLVQVLAGLRVGDNQAALEVFQRYSTRLIALARSRLSKQLQQKIDPEDVAQSVFKSFFQRQGEGRFEIDSWDGLWALLVLITMRKCSRQVEIFHAARRDVRREASPQFNADESHAEWDATSPSPTPEEEAVLIETVSQLMQGMDERERQILMLRLQNYTVMEISQQVGRTERTVHRKLDMFKKRLERHYCDISA